MKRLVLVGEGHGEVSALPTLARKLLLEKDPDRQLFVDDQMVRARDASGLVKWDKQKNQPDHSEWFRKIKQATRRSGVSSVLAVFDGDAATFPAGSRAPFCAATAAKSLAQAAVEVGAGRVFSLAIVFACVEYETWIIAGAESLSGKSFNDGRPALVREVSFPAGDPESHGKRWLEKNCPDYRPTRDQGPLTELLDLGVVRTKKLRSFVRLERAIDQLLEAVIAGKCISTPG